MDEANLIVLEDFGFQWNGAVNQFLIDNELSDDIRVIVHQHKGDLNLIECDFDHDKKYYRKKTCLALEFVTEKANFYYMLRGEDAIRNDLKEYANKNGNRKY